MMKRSFFALVTAGIFLTGCNLMAVSTTVDPDKVKFLIDKNFLYVSVSESLFRKSLNSEGDPQKVRERWRNARISFAAGQSTSEHMPSDIEWNENEPDLAESVGNSTLATLNPPLVIREESIVPVHCGGQIIGFGKSGAICAGKLSCNDGWSGHECDGPHWYPELIALPGRAGAIYFDGARLTFSSSRGDGTRPLCSLDTRKYLKSIGTAQSTVQFYRVGDGPHIAASATAFQPATLASRFESATLSLGEAYIAEFQRDRVDIYYATCKSLLLVGAINQSAVGADVDFDNLKIVDLTGRSSTDPLHIKALFSYRHKSATRDTLALYDGTNLVDIEARAARFAHAQGLPDNAYRFDAAHIIGFAPGQSNFLIISANFTTTHPLLFFRRDHLSLGIYDILHGTVSEQIIDI